MVVSCGLWVSYRLYLGVNVVSFLCFPVVFVNIVGEIGVCFFVLLLFSSFEEFFVYVITNILGFFLFLIM